MYIHSFFLVLLVILVTLGLFIYVGYGLGRFLISKRFDNYFWFIVPFIGISIIVAISEIIGFFGFGAKITLIALMVLATVCNLLAYKLRPAQPYLYHKNLLIFILIFVLLASFPLFYQDKLLTVGNNGDAISYVSVTDYLSDNGSVLPNDTSLRPFPTLVLNVLASGTRLGPMYIQGLVDIVLGMKAYQTFTIISNLFFGLSLISSWLFGRNVLKLKKTSVFLVPLFLGINNLLLWASYDNFIAQMMANAFLPLIIIFLFRAFSSHKEYKDLIITGIFIAALMSIYPETFVYVFLILSIYILLNFIWKKFNLFDVGKVLGIIAVISTVFNPIAFYRFLIFVQQKLSSTEFASEGARKTAGNIGYFLPISEIFGITPHKPIVPYNIPGIIEPLILLLIIFCLIVIILKIATSKKSDRIILISLLCPFILTALFNLYLTFPYGYFKTLSFAVIFFILAFLKGQQDLYIHNITFRPVLRVGICALLIANVLSYSAVVARTAVSPMSLKTEFIELERISNFVGRDKVLFVDQYPPSAQQMWVNYFLKDPKIVLPKAIGYYGSENIFHEKQLADYVLINKNFFQQDKDHRWIQNPVFETKNFKVLSLDKSFLLKKDFSEDKDFVQIKSGEEIWFKTNGNYLEAGADNTLIKIDLNDRNRLNKGFTLIVYGVQDVETQVEIITQNLMGKTSRYKSSISSKFSLKIKDFQKQESLIIRNIDQRPLFLNSIYIFKN